jgi:hypothetical protein
VSIAKHISEISEAKQAERLRKLVLGEWPLEQTDRNLLVGILDQWIDIIKDENNEGGA